MEAKTRKCDECGKPYKPDPRNLSRGWGLTCSKSCAAKKREKARPGYNPATVAENNVRRERWNERHECEDPGDSEYWDHKDFD